MKKGEGLDFSVMLRNFTMELHNFHIHLQPFPFCRFRNFFSHVEELGADDIIVYFFSNAFIDNIGDYKEVHIDVTFKVVGSMYYQLMTLLVISFNHVCADYYYTPDSSLLVI